MALFGGIEAGGTKFVCGVGTPETGSLETAVIPTRDPDTTFRDVQLFFQDAQRRRGSVAGIGVASFGPVDLQPSSSTFGQILATPKPLWEGVDMIARTAKIAKVPIILDTDVNAAALAEATARGVDNLAYVTVGTGIGVGIVSGGRALVGTGHAEMGHIMPRRRPEHGGFAGICPFHGDCLEGLASGPAITAAWSCSPSHIPENHMFWDVEADYLGQLCAILMLTVTPAHIVLGGGVMKQERLFAPIRARTASILAGYLRSARNVADLEPCIVPPICTEAPGLVGAYQLAQRSVAPPTFSYS